MKYNQTEIKSIIKDVMLIEKSEIEYYSDNTDYDAMVQAIELFYNCKGKVVIIGLGKTGAIGRKISSSLASTGTPSFFVHLSESLHGDLGMIEKDDVVFILSYSGESNELKEILNSLLMIGCKVVSMTGNTNSVLATNSDVTINTQVRQEACPNNLAPTTSTTLMLVLGDAIAVSLIKMRNFTSADFALLHPGGSLGKKLKRVSDLMKTGPDLPLCMNTKKLKDAIITMTESKLGVVVLVDETQRLMGIITDGDLRRILLNNENPLDIDVDSIMVRNPKTISADALAVKALNVMEQHKITSLLICDANRKVNGIIHMHHILAAGIYL